MKTKVLLVSGLDDYGVLNFDKYNEIHNISHQQWVERLEKLETKKEYVEERNKRDNLSFSAELFEFDTIDPNFVKFINNEIQDEDDTKHTDFFVVNQNYEEND